MRDRPESTRVTLDVPPELLPPDGGDPPPEPDLPALREVYAHQLRRRERKRLERLCRSILQLTREAPVIVAKIESGAVEDDLRAAAADLRHAERHLLITGKSEGNALDTEERALADLALRLAPRVGEVAAELEAAAEARP